MESEEIILVENALSNAFKPLPLPPDEIPDDDENYPVTILLFYQYIEPPWNDGEFKVAHKTVLRIAKENDINGRGRIAPEGLNCTLSGYAQNIRNFCSALRSWNTIFNETDFKLTDGVPYKQRFKALTIAKQKELVAYGLDGVKAPSLKHNSTEHVEAHEFHRLMQEPNAVVIDVRNAYETAIGHMAPPAGGAEFIDPKMRNSHEFPKWLNAPETKEKLKGKKVLMYCTGGIRCERASALLDQIEKTSSDFNTEGVCMVRGGIERYLKTFPTGGHWKGKNFLFDKRLEQMPTSKSEEELSTEVQSSCCICFKSWSQYRGGHKCSWSKCKVPVIVCDQCIAKDAPATTQLLCPLCVDGHDLRSLPLPDFVGDKRKLLEAEGAVESACDHTLKVRKRNGLRGTTPIGHQLTKKRNVHHCRATEVRALKCCWLEYPDLTSIVTFPGYITSNATEEGVRCSTIRIRLSCEGVVGVRAPDTKTAWTTASLDKEQKC
ncbi:hypothetical protein CYMTET_29243 [Cymbomonas tetramitiformis]|uniref:Rhodanese domain-containing protein n=1 Tax=Cymbomonas tetramitiformis TaxID=36881 RepID=A0AAE0KV46_9CHLO|nr:hypothetical protein CYMTET_29243 [Cymbomonas tetramitiformis]